MPPDSLRAVLDSVFAGPAYRWVESPQPLAFLGRWLGELERWLRGLREANPLGYRLLLAALLLLLAAVLAHAVWVLLRTVRPGGPAAAGPAAEAAPRGGAWYRAEAERFAGSGRYAEAVQSGFLALVLELEGAGLLRFHPGRTPAEYVRDPALPERLRGELGELVRLLYGYAFARRPCGPADYADWRARAARVRDAPAH
jgi:hypothetical protein